MRREVRGGVEGAHVDEVFLEGGVAVGYGCFGRGRLGHFGEETVRRLSRRMGKVVVCYGYV